MGTDKKKPKLSWFEYILFSCIQQGWYNCWYAFKNWADLMGNNYQGYGLLPEDDDLEMCILYFWDSLEDEIYPKEFLENLMQMSEDIRTGKEKVVPMDLDQLKRISDLLDLDDIEDGYV